MEVLSIIIPVYNEATTIAHLLDALIKTELTGNLDKEIIIVDDASSADTKEQITPYLSMALPRCAILFKSHIGNRGKRAAVQTGVKASTGRYVLIQEADLEYDPSDIN